MRPAPILFAVLATGGLTAAAAGLSRAPEPSPELAPAQPPSSLVCYEAATRDTTLDERRAQDLCQGSQTRGPVDCFEAAQDRTTLSDRRSVLLCQCARSVRPVDCYEQADRDTDLSALEILDMCKALTLNEVYLPYCTPAPPPTTPL